MGLGAQVSGDGFGAENLLVCVWEVLLCLDPYAGLMGGGLFLMCEAPLYGWCTGTSLIRNSLGFRTSWSAFGRTTERCSAAPAILNPQLYFSP